MRTENFILTRFNLRLWNLDKQNQFTHTKEWLEERFDLFEHYCLPSVMHQTESDFTWIILIDSETSECYLNQLKQDIVRHRDNEETKLPYVKLIRVKPQASFYFTRVYSDVMKDVLVKKYQTEQTPLRIITTRLDNDDALILDFIERMKKASENTPSHSVISFVWGRQYFKSMSLSLRVKVANNHFISYVEDINSIESTLPLNVFCIYGQRYKNSNHIEIKDKSGGWLEVVHNRNVSNDVLGRSWPHYDPDKQVLHRFGINDEVDNSLSTYCFRFTPHAVIWLWHKVILLLIENNK